MNSNVKQKSEWQQLFSEYMQQCQFSENGFMRFDRVEGHTKHWVQHLAGELYYYTAEYHSTIMGYGPWTKRLMVNKFVPVPAAIAILSGVQAINLDLIPADYDHI